MCDDNLKPFIDMLCKLLLAPDLCDKLFSIIALIDQVNTYLFHKGFCIIFFGDTKYNAVILPHREHRKHAFLVNTKEKKKSQNQIHKKKLSLE